jgi:hypothetical protein
MEKQNLLVHKGGSLRSHASPLQCTCPWPTRLKSASQTYLYTAPRKFLTATRRPWRISGSWLGSQAPRARKTGKKLDWDVEKAAKYCVPRCRFSMCIRSFIWASFKGIVARDEFLFKGLTNQISGFCTCADNFKNFFKTYWWENQNKDIACFYELTY